MARLRLVSFTVPLLCLAACCCVHAQAEETNDVETHLTSQGALPITQVDARSLPMLAQQAPQSPAIELQASRSQIEAAPQAWPALSQWVRSGGIVLLHNDAAQLFGYKTVAARGRTNRLAGQLFGRARSAIAPAASPLLWGTSKAEAARTGGVRTQGLVGVHTVYYRLQPGDHLVQDHPIGMPLLRVTDLVVPPGPSLFAAVLAPYGRGWAIFTPRLVESHRADGALFMQNLLAFIQRASSPARSSQNALIGVSIPPLEGAVASAVQALRAEGGEWDHPSVLKALAQAIEVTPAEDARPDGADEDAPALLLTREEITNALDLGQGLQDPAAAAQQKQQASMQLAALVATWGARIYLQRNNLEKALSLLDSLKDKAAQSPEVGLWRGLLLAQSAEDITLRTRQQVSLLEEADQAWQQTLKLSQAMRPRSTNVESSQDDPRGDDPSISGVPLSLLGLWREQVLQATEAVRHLPGIPPGQPTGHMPIIVMGTADSPVVIRRSGAGLGGGPGPINQWAALWAGETSQLKMRQDPIFMKKGMGSGPTNNFPRISMHGQYVSRPPKRADQLLSRASAALGWRPDQVEIIAFDGGGLGGMNYQEYRQIIGIPQQMPLPVIDINQEVFKRFTYQTGMVPRTPSYGDVIGNRLLMTDGIMQSGRKSFSGNNPAVDVPSTFYPATTLYPTSLGRMYSYVLMNQLAGGGMAPPDWMQLGLAARSALSVMRDLELDIPDSGFSPAEMLPATLLRKMAAVGVLTPVQFRGITNDPQRCPLAEPQAILMMEFFYARFGTGCVVETLQRLGAGQSVDEALEATTGLTEAQFFQAWSAALG